VLDCPVEEHAVDAILGEVDPMPQGNMRKSHDIARDEVEVLGVERRSAWRLRPPVGPQYAVEAKSDQIAIPSGGRAAP